MPEERTLIDIDVVIEALKEEKPLSIIETSLLSIAQSLQMLRDEVGYISWMMEQTIEDEFEPTHRPANKMDS